MGAAYIPIDRLVCAQEALGMAQFELLVNAGCLALGLGLGIALAAAWFVARRG